MQKIITNPHPVTVSQEEDAIFNLSINFDLLFFAGLSKIKDKKIQLHLILILLSHQSILIEQYFNRQIHGL